ncbi:hypothetical protein [Clostridium tyrobutyricum]|uniref:hypothetical protein n=1 Tax=Clostridium tyrobutyricum TaxID=1519 RepID=UPI0003A8C6B4|nr:hypothetical protein [Clostridium tyrobutyricum]
MHEAKTKKLDKSENQDIDVLKDIIKEKSMEQEDKDEDFEDIGDFDELEDREKELK